MTVWILTGEYATSENGETFWIEGVYKTRAAAIAAANLAATDDEWKGRKVTVTADLPEVDAEALAALGWTEEEVEDDDLTDWEVNFSVEEREVYS